MGGTVGALNSLQPCFAPLSEPPRWAKDSQRLTSVITARFYATN